MNSWELDGGRHNPTEVEIIFKWKCAVVGCDEIHTETHLGFALYLPERPPEGWRRIGLYVWVCPKHEVVVTVDGKESTEATR
jgi:hypothetical protein